jgi:hypothetical protein
MDTTLLAISREFLATLTLEETCFLLQWAPKPPPGRTEGTKVIAYGPK